MRVLAACSLGGAGHWIPLSSVALGATERGDDVMVIGPPALREMVEHRGFEFTAGDEPSEADVAPIRERLPTASTGDASVLGNRELFGRLAARAMLPSAASVIASWKPDLVLRDPCEYASAAVAGELGIRSAQVAISLADVEWRSLAVASPALEELRDGLTAEIAGSPYISHLPGLLDPSPYTTTLRYRRSPAPRIEPPTDLWGPGSGPLVYVTLGTVLPHMTFAAERYRLVLEALSLLEARILVSVGRFFDPGSLGRLAPNVRVERWVDHDAVLAVADLVVCHGGSGTVFGALDARVPSVVIPSFADQFVNGRLVAEHGLGRMVELTRADGDQPALRDHDIERIRSAAEMVLADPAHRSRLEQLAATAAAVPTPDALLTRLIG